LDCSRFYACISVDGLVKCNEQLTRSSNEEKSNASNVNGHNHVGSNFPFLDGSLFTATIWVGEEGFYATVNGRHETSFAYREVRYDDFQARTAIHIMLRLYLEIVLHS